MIQILFTNEICSPVSALVSLVERRLVGQTTEGTILGRVTDAVTGEVITTARVTAVQRDTGAHFESSTPGGAYILVRLPPGFYDLSVENGDKYRQARVESIELPVAGFLQQNFSLRTLKDLWQQNILRSYVARDQRTILRFYGPDVDLSRSIAIESAPEVRGTLEPTISQVMSPQSIDYGLPPARPGCVRTDYPGPRGGGRTGDFARHWRFSQWTTRIVEQLSPRRSREQQLLNHRTIFATSA